MTSDAVFSRAEFAQLDEELRIGIVIADGMWWSLEKWAKHSKVSKETLQKWILEHLSTGELIQSETGARSYRFPLESIKNWYRDHGYPLDTRLVEFLFPPRIWDDIAEIDGFAMAPLRETGTVKFACSANVAVEVKKALKGVARVREEKPGVYRAFSLSSSYAKSIVTRVFAKYDPAEHSGTHSRMIVWRRELADFPPDFAVELISFYQSFAMTLVKGLMETIKIYLPDREDQISQITYWVISAIERFDEKASVPFSGYLNTVLMRWPYDLTYDYLGKDLADFQRSRSKALKRLRKETGEEDATFTHADLANAMGMDSKEFADLESKHRVWLGSKSATTLTWDQSSEEKLIENNVTGGVDSYAAPSDIGLAHKLSIAIVNAALATKLYDDAFGLISQVDAASLDNEKIQASDPDFIAALGREFGVDS